ncbi:hypothetical protein EVAR_6386_1 [Eumeta japonica]|uniref:Uncharacterized protein n=1 Tax=Eumeta variegata TaxID=151549 RepID=A0A4C1TFI3_EUMVA|nr:hypothetical protein EVAR_6386_1 [Eumeta japonica]
MPQKNDEDGYALATGCDGSRVLTSFGDRENYCAWTRQIHPGTPAKRLEDKPPTSCSSIYYLHLQELLSSPVRLSQESCRVHKTRQSVPLKNYRAWVSLVSEALRLREAGSALTMVEGVKRTRYQTVADVGEVVGVINKLESFYYCNRVRASPD